MRTHLVLAALAATLSTLTVPASGQNAGLTPEQLMRLRAVTSVHESANGTMVVFTRAEPRPAGDPPGPAYQHLYLLERDAAGVAGAAGEPTERLLVGGKRSVQHAATDPVEGQITFLMKGDGDAHAEVYAIPRQGGEPTKLFETPGGVQAYEWRSDGKTLAFTALDPLPDARARAEKLGFQPRVVDEDFRHVSLWLWDRAGAQARQLTHDCTVFAFHWSEDGSRIAAAIAPRNLVDDSYMFTRLHVVDPASGDVTLLADNPGKLGAFAWSWRGDRVAYAGAADRNDPHAGMLWVVGVPPAGTGPGAGDHAAASAGAGDRAPRCLTPELRGMVHDLQWGVLNTGKELLTVVLSRGVETRLATVDPDSGAITGEAVPCADAPEFRTIAGSWGKVGPHFFAGSTPSHPPELYGAGFGRSDFRRLTDSNPWLAGVALAEQEVVRFRARDGLEIEGLLLHPLERREGARVPLVIVAHGGPEAHFGNGWLTSYSNWGQLLAARGYFSWYPNYRASTGYGVAFAKADHGDPMGAEFEDHLDSIAHLRDRGLVDADRVGIGGGSYGGYTAAWAATRRSEHFAAAVSFVPFTDIRTKWLTTDILSEFYFVHYQEKWPHEQAGFLADRSPLTWAAQCKTPLLLLGGTADPRVHPSQPFMLYRAVKLATDTPVRYVQYPGEQHGNRTNVYQYDYVVRTLQWFDWYLRPGDHRRDAPPPFALDYAAWGAGASAAPATNGAR